MADIHRLAADIKASRKSLESLSFESGIGCKRLLLLLSGEDEFRASEITGIASSLGLSARELGCIFFH